MSEVSRESLRDFLSHQLSIDLPWDKFDAVAQKIDVNKSGFVNSHEVVSAFLKLTPLVERLDPWKAQLACQLLLGVCADTLLHFYQEMSQARSASEKKYTLSELWLRFLVSRQDSSPSFRKYLQSLELADTGPMPSGLNGMQLSLSQMSLLSGKELRQHIESKWVEDQLFIADVMFELSKDFFATIQQVVTDANHPTG